MGMVLSIKNQRLILYLNLKWFESKDLSNKFLKFENIVYGLGIIIS